MIIIINIIIIIIVIIIIIIIIFSFLLKSSILSFQSYLSYDYEKYVICTEFLLYQPLFRISIYTLSDLVVLSNLIGSLSLANGHYSPPTE